MSDLSSNTSLTNGTLVLTPELMMAYSAIVTMAVIPIYIGSFLSLRKEKPLNGSQEGPMTNKDAYMFPIIGSGVLFGLYILFRVFSKEYVNLLLTVYFLFLGFYALAETFVHIIGRISPALKHSKVREYSYQLPWKNEKEKIVFNHADIISWILSGLLLVWYSLTKHWIANNFIGLAFCVQGVSLISLGSYQTGCILLGGLFFYDIFWVFGTDVMVTVAKSFDAPIKLVFPKNILTAAEYTFSMLGLGDIVIPGIFIALLLRYDLYRCQRDRVLYDNSYFKLTLTAYTVGLMTTIFVMHTFQAAQPALLYLVPACVGSSAACGYLLGDFGNLITYEEKASETTTTKTDKKSDPKSPAKSPNHNTPKRKKKI